MRGVMPPPGLGGLGPGDVQSQGQRPQSSAVALSRQLNQQITTAANLQELVHAVVVNFNRMNAVNFCTAYHRIARHVQDQRTPPDMWPQAQQQQVGRLLTELNQALMDRLGEVQAHNLGLTLWSISKTYKLPQENCDQLWAALQVEVERRLSSVDRDTYMTDKFYNFGAQSLSNIVYSAAAMGLKPDYDLLHAVARGVVWEVEEMKPQGLANILWGLGKMGVKVTHEVRQMLDALCGEMLSQLTHARHKGNFAPQNISNTLHGLVNIGIPPPPELLSALVRCADGMLRQFGPQELTNTAWALSQMHRAGVHFTPDVEALLDRIPDELALLFGDRSWRSRVKPQTISNLANAYAHLGRVPQLLMRDLMKEALPLLPQFKPQELSNLLWSIAAMDYYPGSGVVEAITKAAAAAADRMKPQELANLCWAWATLRFFPGAAAMDAVLACAEAQLERFKSQELGNLCWAVSKLAYMPAAAFLRAALPHIAAWRTPTVQDCGNVLWALTILDILTPEVVQLLANKLLALPRESFTQEAYIQLYQAKMSLSQQVHSIAQYVPPELLAQGETEWRSQSRVTKVSITHRDVAAVFRELRIDFELEKKIEDGLISVDIALRNEMVAVEVDGSAHFTQNEPYVPLGRTIWRWRILASRGWRVVSVPYYRWARLESLAAKKQFLYQLLQCNSVWECLSLEPGARDGVQHPPANLCHLLPEEVFQLAAEGVAPSSLVTATPTASPNTPLLAQLGPSGGSGSAGVSPALGLHQRPSSGGVPGSLLPTPVALGGGGGLGLSAPGSAGLAASGATAYGRLPDSIYGSESPTSSAGGSSITLGGGARLAGSGSGTGLNVGARPFTFGGASAGAPAFARPGGAGHGSSGSSAAAFSPAVASRVGGPSASASPSGSSFGGASSLAASAPSLSPALPLGDYQASPVVHSRGFSSSLSSSATVSPAPPAFGGGSLHGLQGPPSQQLPVPGLLPPRVHHLQQAAAQQQQQQQREGSPSAGSGLPSSSRLSSEAGNGGGSSLNLGGEDSDDDVSDLRSYFGSVIGLSPAGEPPPPAGPLSVEEVRRKLALLPADAAVADVVPGWLAGWEAAGVVELLLQLDSPTTAQRALQLFEWLRALPPDSPHAHLCTPDTFAAMIGLYGRWRRPKAAVRLFAELKGRGEDGAEVHSALVEAFCRSGQPDVALDAFLHMRSLGLAPSPAAFRAVLGVHLGRGDWEEADVVLGAMAEAPGALDAELVTGIMERASGAGHLALVQSAYDHLVHAGESPASATFAALLGALRRQRPADEVAELALGLAEQAEAAGAAGAMQALLEACRGHGLWDLSLLLLEAVEAGGGAPSIAQVDGALAACAAAGAVPEARQAFAVLSRHGLEPSPASYMHLAEALVAAGQWAAAVREYQALLQAGAAPSEPLVSLVVDALWGTGLAWAQAKALEVFDQAISEGWLARAEESAHKGLLKVDLRAQHLGTGMLRMRRWLADLRGAIGNSGAPCVLDATKRVCVISGRADDGASPDSASAAAAAAALQLSSRLKGALGSSLVLHKAPFRVTLEGGRATRIESSTFMVKKWLFSESFDEWDLVFSGAAALAATGATAGDVEARLLCDAQLEEEAAQTYALIREYESLHPADHAMPAGLAPAAAERRRELVQVASHLAAGLGLGATAQLWHAAVALLDRCAALGYQPRQDAAHVAACVALAAEREGMPLDLASLAAQLGQMQGAGGDPEAALQGEMQAAVAALQGDTSCLTAVHCWKVFADRMQCNVEDDAQALALMGDSFARLHALLGEEFVLKHSPSVQAAAALYAARKARGVVPFWPSVLQHLTGYEEDGTKEFADALRELQQTSGLGSTVQQAVFS